MPAKFDPQRVKTELKAGLQALAVEIPAATQDALVAFIGELHRWNQTYNLTAVRDPLDMVARHVLDSLTVLPCIRGERVLDVGCGAGLPGFPIALCLPGKHFVLLDSNSKKQRFVEHVCRRLSLRHVEPAHARVESYTAEPFDTIVCRALTTLTEFVAGSQHLLAPGGCLVAMKGRLPIAELAELPADWVVTKQHRVVVPGLDAERHIIEMAKA